MRVSTRIGAIKVEWDKYISDDEKRQYFCRDCGSLIMAGRVARTVEWWPGAGPGDVHMCEIPFCPRCEPEKEFQYGPGIPEEELATHECPKNW